TTANAQINLDLFCTPIAQGTLENTPISFLQLRVLSQKTPQAACFRQQAHHAAEQLGGTEQDHINLNAIYGKTCGYHALRNGFLTLLLLHDYDELVHACTTNDNDAIDQKAEFVHSDIESLTNPETTLFNSWCF